MYLSHLFIYLQTCLKTFLCFGVIGRFLLAPMMIIAVGVSGCTSFSSSSLPSFGFGGSSSSSSPDCSEIEQRMGAAHKKYARALRREQAAIYLTFTGNLSRTMRNNQIRGLYQLTDYHLDRVVDRTSDACFMASLDNKVCRGANRLGRAYKPLVLVAREAHQNYCGNRPFRAQFKTPH